MVCPKCKAPNPDEKRFCADCGCGLDPVDEEFRSRVKGLLREHLKDQKLVEIETADAVMARLKTMARPFLYVLALFLTVLGILGFRSLRDVFEALKSEQATAVQKLREQASNESRALTSEADAIRAQFRKIGDQQELVAQLRQTESQLRSIQMASQGLKQRYEKLGTELAMSQGGGVSAGNGARTALKAPSEAGIRAGGGGGGSGSGTDSAPSVLAIGSSGPEVTRVQRRLHELGCYSGAISGEFDQATRNAVSRFNEARGDALAIGIVDQATSAALFTTARTVRCR
jgi:hypothetical protein